MATLPSDIVGLWLNKLFVSIIDPDRSREAFKRTSGFKSPAFIDALGAQSVEADHLVFDTSFMPDLPDMKTALAAADRDVLDVIIYRFAHRMQELRSAPGELHFDGQPDIRAAFRLFLIEDDRVRNGPWPTH